jgi:hypothetical protein
MFFFMVLTVRASAGAVALRKAEVASSSASAAGAAVVEKHRRALAAEALALSATPATGARSDSAPSCEVSTLSILVRRSIGRSVGRGRSLEVTRAGLAAVIAAQTRGSGTRGGTSNRRYVHWKL